ncbi:MAG: DUF4412 domain-containing protein [Desulfobacterales bacterium]|nr:DUF4412 domain-containing protein [Desulfobacterales bacterium]
MKIFGNRNRKAAVWTLLVLSWAAAGFAQKVSDFTAEQVTMGADGKILSQTKVYFSGGKMRLDDAMPQSGTKLIMISRGDLKKMYMINADKNIYTESDIDEKEFAGLAMPHVKNRKERALGEETVNGYPCAKKEIEAQVEVMGFKSTSRTVIWQSPKFDMPLRTRGEDGHVTELRNIQQSQPAAALFEVPAGSSRVANMMELLGEERPTGSRAPKPAPGGKGGGARFPAELPPGMKVPYPKQ